MAKWVYMFTEGNADMRNLLGWKRRKPGRDDKPGTSCTTGIHGNTEACTQYYEDGRQINDEISGSDHGSNR